MRKLTVLATFLLLAMSPQPVMSNAASSAATDGTAVFNTPRPFSKADEANFAIVNQVDRAIRGVPKHARTSKKPQPVIHITTFLMDHTRSVSDLIEACKRGVAVRVIIDQDIENANSRRLISALNGDNVTDRNHDGKADRKAKRGPCNRPLRRHRVAPQRPSIAPGGEVQMSRAQVARSVDAPLGDSVTWGKDGSYVKRCKPSCRSGQGNMHMKIYLFSQTGKSHDVVMVSSSNINRGGAKLGWNDMYIMRGRPESYAEYVQQHLAMTYGKPAPREGVFFKDGPYTSRFFPIRDAGQKKDPVMKDLRKVECRGSAWGATQLNISMFYWKGTRGNYIASKLLNMARAGCRISIIYGAPSRQIAQRLRTAAQNHLIDLYDSRWDFNEDGWNEVRTHSKFVLVRGTYAGNPKKWVVMTGSPNWVAGSLRKGDESTLNIELKSAYDAYLANWVRMREHSRKLPYTGPIITTPPA
jgi:hypothetical protein